MDSIEVSWFWPTQRTLLSSEWFAFHQLHRRTMPLQLVRLSPGRKLRTSKGNRTSVMAQQEFTGTCASVSVLQTKISSPHTHSNQQQKYQIS